MLNCYVSTSADPHLKCATGGRNATFTSTPKDTVPKEQFALETAVRHTMEESVNVRVDAGEICQHIRSFWLVVIHFELCLLCMICLLSHVPPRRFGV